MSQEAMNRLEAVVAIAVAKAIADPTERKILVATADRGRSIEEISSATGMPLATCYRKVHELVQLDLLALDETVITSKGKKFEKFVRTFRHLVISLDNEGLSVWDDNSPVFPIETTFA